MSETMPRTPFSTNLSGSAKETELRIRNIMSGPKKRPPVLFLVLVFSLCLLCGNLVSCQIVEAEQIAFGTASSEEAAPLSEAEQALLDALFQAAERENGDSFQTPTASLLSFIQQGGRTLAAAFVEDHLENTLILGIVDKETGKVIDGVFQCACHIGVPNIVTFQNQEGDYCLLYTLTGQMNGQRTGEAGVVRLDGEQMTWTWPVEGDVRGPLQEEYETYWNTHLALLSPGGLDVYCVNPEFEWGKEEPASMWQIDHGETFYHDSSSATELPMPIYYDALNWLNENAEPEAGWRILSLTLNEEKCDPEKKTDCYTLWAHTDDDVCECVADLYFPYVQEGQRRAYEGLDGQTSIPMTGYTRSRGNSTDDRVHPVKDNDWDWDWDDEKWEVWDEEWEKEQEAKQIAEYQSVGVAMDGKDYYYQNQLVNIFLDQRPDRSVYTLNRNPAGTVNVKILRADDGTITGAAYLNDAETAELNERFED